MHAPCISVASLEYPSAQPHVSTRTSWMSMEQMSAFARSTTTVPVNGLVIQHLSESRWPRMRKSGMLWRSLTFARLWSPLLCTYVLQRRFQSGHFAQWQISMFELSNSTSKIFSLYYIEPRTCNAVTHLTALGSQLWMLQVGRLYPCNYSSLLAEVATPKAGGNWVGRLW